MTRTLLVVPSAADAGLARTSLGLVRALDRRGVNVAYVKPVAQPRHDGSPDRSAALVAAISALRPPEPLSTAELEQQLGEGGLDAVLEKIVAAWQPVYDRSDVVVVEGLSPGPARLYASELNQALARALDADVVLVGRWPAADAGRQDRAGRAAEPGLSLPGNVEDLAETLAITASRYWSGEHARVVGCVVHSLPVTGPSVAAQLGEALTRHGLRLLAAVPHRPELTWLRVRDLVRELDPQVLDEGDLSRRIKDVAVFAQGVPGGLRVLTEGRLVVVPGDRHDVVMAACLAELNGTRLAALLLSAGIAPDPAGLGTDPGRVRHRPAHSGRRRRQLRDRDAGTRPRPGTAGRRPGTDRGRDRQHRRCAGRVLAGVAARLRAVPPAQPRGLPLPGWSSWLAPPTRASSCPRAPSPALVQAAVACAERGIARSVLLGPPDQVAAAGPQPRAASCPTASPWSTPRTSPSATSPRWPSCGGTAAGPRRWPASTSPTRSWSAP